MRVQCKYEFKKKFMKIEFQNTIKRLSFFVPSTGHQNCLDSITNITEFTCIPKITSITEIT